MANGNVGQEKLFCFTIVWASRKIVKQILDHAKIIPIKASLTKNGCSKGNKFIW